MERYSEQIAPEDLAAHWLVEDVAFDPPLQSFPKFALQDSKTGWLLFQDIDSVLQRCWPASAEDIAAAAFLAFVAAAAGADFVVAVQ